MTMKQTTPEQRQYMVPIDELLGSDTKEDTLVDQPDFPTTPLGSEREAAEARAATERSMYGVATGDFVQYQNPKTGSLEADWRVLAIRHDADDSTVIRATIMPAGEQSDVSDDVGFHSIRTLPINELHEMQPTPNDTAHDLGSQAAKSSVRF